MFKISRNILLGIIITLSGSFLYVLMGALSKTLGKHLPINHIIFLQSISGLLCASYFIRIRKYKWQQLLTKQKFFHLARIVMSLASVYTLIDGLQYVSIFNALVILNSAPLIIPLLRKLFFKKKIHFLVFLSALLAFAGIVLILGPDRHIIEGPIVIILVSMLCMSLSLLMLEKTQDIDPNLSIFYYFLYSSLVIGSLLMYQHQFFSIPMQYVPMGMMIGVLFFFVQLSVIYAAQYISSQLISVLFYGEIIIALFASILLEGMKLNNYLFTGTALVILGGLAVVLIENNSQSLFKNHQLETPEEA